MANVRPALRNEILQELDNTAFGKDLFDTKIQEQDFLIKVVYLPRPQFTFTIKKLPEIVAGRYQFVTFEAPGQWMLETEEIQHENFAQARGRIQQWARRIEADYRATSPDFEGLEELRSQIMEEFSASDIKEGERFSHEEKQRVDKKLNELQERLEILLKDKHAKESKLGMMREQIRKLKDAVEILDKRTWALAAANRVLNIFKEVRAAVGEVTMLTNDIKNLLPDLSKGEGDPDSQEDSLEK